MYLSKRYHSYLKHLNTSNLDQTHGNKNKSKIGKKHTKTTDIDTNLEAVISQGDKNWRMI